MLCCSWYKTLDYIYLQAYKSGLRYPRYVFLTYGTYEPRWWEVPGEEFGTSSGCNSHNVAKTLEFSLAATHFPSQPFPVNTSFESEPEQEILRLSDDQRNHSYHFPFSADAELYHQCYDATLTLALALNKTIAAGLQLLNDNFDINVLTDLIEESNFIGLSVCLYLRVMDCLHPLLHVYNYVAGSSSLR